MAHQSTELTLRKLRGDTRFLLVEKVEFFSPFPKPHGRRVDLFGLGDVLAIGPGISLLVQCTSVGGVSTRKKKLTEDPNTALLLRSGWELEIWGWHKPAHRWERGRFHRFEYTQQPGETT